MLSLKDRFPTLSLESYVIMPNHIHMILVLQNDAGGASPSPTISDIVCSFKSLTSRICKEKYNVEKLFQRSFMDHIIRDREDYRTRTNYIIKNPSNWICDELYAKE